MPSDDEVQSKLKWSNEELVKAAKLGDLSAFHSLSRYELSDALDIRSDEGQSLLQIAVSSGNSQVAEFLAHSDTSRGFIQVSNECSGSDVNLANAVDEDGQTILHRVARDGKVEDAQKLILQGANIHVKDKAGNTPLHCAARAGHFKLCELLLKEGAEINPVDNFGQTPLMTAVMHEHQEVIHELIRWLISRYFNNGP